MKNLKKIEPRPLQNEQNDPVFCSECGKAANSIKQEEGCVCESKREPAPAAKLPVKK